MAVTLSLFAGAGAQFFDNNGTPLSGGKIYTYAAGTTTPRETYTTASNASLHTNPIVLDSAGRVPSGGEIWLILGQGYKFLLKTSAEVLIATYDNIPSAAQPPAANDADSILYEQGYTVTAGSFVTGKTYRIVSVGTTNFTLIGALSNTQGLHFIATGPGTGTGTAELSQTVETKLREIVSVKDFGATGDGTTDDSAEIQTAIDSLSAGSVLYFPDGEYLVNSTCTVTTDDITIDFGGAIILNTDPVTTFTWQSQGVNPLFFFNANNGRVLNGHFVDCVSQGVLSGGVLNNNKTGFYISGTRFTNLVVANVNQESKCVQVRHVNNIVYDGIVCKNIGITKTSRYSPPLSINYSDNAVITNCIVDGDAEGGGANFLYVENGSISNCQLVNISNVSAGQQINGIHVKYSNQIEITGNTAKVLGVSVKVSEDTNFVTVTGNYFETVSSNPFAGVYFQGPSKLTFTGNVVVCQTNRAIFISPHITTDPVDMVISNNYIRGNYNASTGLNTTPTTYGSGMQINGGLLTNPRGPIMVANNLFHNCDLWMFQCVKSAIKGNFFQRDIDMFNNTDSFNGTALTLAGGSSIWSESNVDCVIADNSVLISQTTPATNQIGLRLFGNQNTVISNNSIKFAPTSTDTYDYDAQASTSNVRFTRNTSFFAENPNYYPLSGNAYFGCDDTPSATVSGVAILYDGSTSVDAYFSSPTTSGDALIRFINPNGTVGTITTSGSATAYNVSSDHRLKENVQPMTSGLDRVMALKPVTYQWKVDGGQGEGFIAHELAEVCPQAVTGEKDAVDNEGKPQYQGVDTSFLVATLVSAIQELNARIESLEK